MRKMMNCFLLIGWGWTLLFLTSIVEATEEKSFIFHSKPQGGNIPEFLLHPDVIKWPMKQLEIAIDIPGLPKIEKMKFIYVEYSGRIPENWGGMRMIWKVDEDKYWPLGVHIAVRKGVGFPIIYHEAYHIGFLAALSKAGVDLSKVFSGDGREVYVTAGGKDWSFTQIEEAVATAGLIRYARIVDKPNIVQDEFNVASMVSGSAYDDYELRKFIIRMSEKNPDKYLEILGTFLESFIKMVPREQGLADKKFEKATRDKNK